LHLTFANVTIVLGVVKFLTLNKVSTIFFASFGVNNGIDGLVAMPERRLKIKVRGD
jgi:hypothetical protein